MATYRHAAATAHDGRLAAEDLRNFTYHSVRFDADGGVVLSGAGESHGILLNTPDVGEPAEVATGDTFAVVAGAPFGSGAKLRSDARSRLVVAAAGQVFEYVAEAPSTADGDIVPVRRESGQA